MCALACCIVLAQPVQMRSSACIQTSWPIRLHICPSPRAAAPPAVYFDGPDLPVYHTRLARLDGAKLVRIRWVPTHRGLLAATYCSVSSAGPVIA
jgi:hypothetical protein